MKSVCFVHLSPQDKSWYMKYSSRWFFFYPTLCHISVFLAEAITTSQVGATEPGSAPRFLPLKRQFSFSGASYSLHYSLAQLIQPPSTLKCYYIAWSFAPWANKYILTSFHFLSIGPERRWGHWQVVPGPSSACQTVSDLAACLATRGLEPKRRCYTCHQLRPAVCSSQARSWSVLGRSSTYLNTQPGNVCDWMNHPDTTMMKRCIMNG